MLLNVVAHNVCIWNVKVSTLTASQNVKVTLHNGYKTFFNVYVLWHCTLCDVYVLKTFVLELLHCVQLLFVTLCHVTFTLCCFMLCSNILIRVNLRFFPGCCWIQMLIRWSWNELFSLSLICVTGQMTNAWQGAGFSSCFTFTDEESEIARGGPKV